VEAFRRCLSDTDHAKDIGAMDLFVVPTIGFVRAPEKCRARLDERAAS